MRSNLIPIHFLGMTLHADATYEPGGEGDRDCPPWDESFDIGQVFGPDRVTPVALTDLQMDRLEEALLEQRRKEADYNDYCDRS